MSELRSPFWKEEITKGRVLFLKVTGLLSGRRPLFQPPSHDSAQGEFTNCITCWPPTSDHQVLLVRGFLRASGPTGLWPALTLAAAQIQRAVILVRDASMPLSLEERRGGEQGEAQPRTHIPPTTSPPPNGLIMSQLRFASK